MKKGIEEISVKYTSAVVSYKKWKFRVYQIPGIHVKGDYEIQVSHDYLDGGEVFLNTDRKEGYIAPRGITSMDEALEIIQDFISKEL